LWGTEGKGEETGDERDKKESEGKGSTKGKKEIRRTLWGTEGKGEETGDERDKKEFVGNRWTGEE
jgi:hypothetical protein